jgi:molybdate transport system substrate-binding protein
MRFRSMSLAGCLAGVLLVPFLMVSPVAAQAQTTMVFAAASLTDVMKDIDTLWQAKGHAKLRLSFAASSTLARQIEQGADANLFASADEQWMDDLQKHDLVAAGTRRTLLGNALVLVMPKDRVHPVAIGPGFDIMALLGPDGRLATGDPSNVPVGIYAQQALTRLGLWDQVKQRLAPTDSVRSALLLVERGEAPLGIVYSTDAAVSPGVAIAGTFPDSSHDPVTYPFAVTRTGDTPEARALLDFLAGPEAGAAFAKRGFTKPPQ